jgi:hypothetical protein
MSKTTDWLPGTRTAQLTMAKNWFAVMTPQKSQWGIPDSVLMGLNGEITNAENALTKAQNEETRTPVATAQCKEAFDKLVGLMHDIKRRYFLTPPLQDSDYIALGLKPHDTTPTASGTPTAQVTIETYLVGRHELGVKIIYDTGNPADPANKGYRIYYKVIAQGETPPTEPHELTESFYTKRKKDIIEFGFGDSGKTAHFAVQIENDGKKGPWGPLTNALIP